MKTAQANKQGYVGVMGKKIRTLVTNSQIQVIGPQHLAEHGMSTVFAPQGTFISKQQVGIPQGSVRVPCRTAALIGVESCGYPFVNLQKGKGGAEVVKPINKFEGAQ